MNAEIEKYITIANFLNKIMGSNSEILIHDFTDLKKSIVYIINGHISNRKVGDSITDLALEFLKGKSSDDNDFICNYNSKTINQKVLYSSTLFIRDSKKNVIGALCINSDYSDIDKSIDLLQSLIPNYGTRDSNKEIKENLSTDSTQLTSNKISSIIDKYNVSPERMNTSEKEKVITELYDSGVFMIRGAVPEVAEKLSMSEPSIYRYLKKIKITIKEQTL